MLTTTQLLRTVEQQTGRTLNDDQKRAVAHDGGPLWILAGPGSGKTEVLVLRCLKLALVDGAEPRSIILTTFTEKAARAMQERLLTRKAAIAAKFPATISVDVSAIRVGTLHSLANDIMREFRYLPYQNIQLLDELEQLMFLHKKAAIAAGQAGWAKRPPPDDFWVTFGFLLDRHTQFYPGRWKRAKAGVDLFDRIVEDRIDIDSMRKAGETNLRLAVELYEDYVRELKKANYVDFAHLQLHFLRFLDSPQAKLFLVGDGSPSRPGVSHVLVDEYQDTNPIQEMIYFKLATRAPHNLSVVGDDEQALYRFRGGDVRCILSFEEAARNHFRTNATKVYLTTNYRSLRPIVDFYNLLALSSGTTRKLRQIVGKPNIRAVREDNGDHPVVAMIRRSQTSDTALEFAKFARDLKGRGIISEYSDCALLVRSTRERRPNGNLTESGEYARALRAAKVPVYNPRSRAMLEQPEVQITLGALLEAVDSIDRLGEFSRNQLLQNRLLADWRRAFQEAAQDSPLAKYVGNVGAAISKMPISCVLDMELLEIFYNIISQEPLRLSQDDPEQTLRLSQLSSVFESFVSVYGERLEIDPRNAGEVSLIWKRDFYYSFLDLLLSEGMNDFEDEEESFPRGRLPIMTFHQAKGLEFPIIFVGSLTVTQDSLRWRAQSKEFALEDMLRPYGTSLGSHKLPPFDTFERAEQDMIRLYYVAYSRAQNALILLMDETSGPAKSLTLGDAEMEKVIVRL